MNFHSYNQVPVNVIKANSKVISRFNTEVSDKNIDEEVVASFGDEWETFDSFNEQELRHLGDMYFDIITDNMLNSDTYGIDIGCGSGRWSKYLLEHKKIGKLECVDPSKAIFVAAHMLANYNNVRLSQCSTDNLPFEDQTFDFGMSVGVLHHIPDTQKALNSCVKKIKQGGFFYVYLYYNLENRGNLFKMLFQLVDGTRKVISKLPKDLKKFTCDLIAIFIYLPLALSGRLISKIGLKKLAGKLPLNSYQDCSFHIMRNDALDRFGTSLEQRFSKKQIEEMMQKAGLDNITFSQGLPYWHAVGQKVN